MPKPGIYGWTTQEGGVHFHRIGEPLRVYGERGGRAAFGRVMSDRIATEYDTVLVHMLHDERNSEAWEKLAANGNHRLIFDVDDVMWDPDYRPFRQHYTPDVLARLWRNIGLAHVVTTPSRDIAAQLAKHNPNIWYVPNTVPEYALNTKRETRGVRRVIGYQGSASHHRDLQEHGWADQLYAFCRDHSRWDFHIWGQHSTPVFYPGRTFSHPWQSSMPRYYRGLQMDIGVGPLADTPFNRGKSALRAIEYATLGIVPVLTDLEPYRGWIVNGVNGFLIPPGEPWYPVLHDLAVDGDLRNRIRKAAKASAREWTTEANLDTWLNAWNSVQSS